MINAGDATFDLRPEALNVISMCLASNIDFSSMIYSLVIKADSCKVIIARKFVSIKNCIGGYLLRNKRNYCRAFYIRYNRSFSFTFPLYSTDDGSFIFRTTPTLSSSFTSYISFVSLNFTENVPTSSLRSLRISLNIRQAVL